MNYTLFSIDSLKILELVVLVLSVGSIGALLDRSTAENGILFVQWTTALCLHIDSGRYFGDSATDDDFSSLFQKKSENRIGAMFITLMNKICLANVLVKRQKGNTDRTRREMSIKICEDRGWKINFLKIIKILGIPP